MTPRVREPSLVCPECGLRFDGQARFCPDCKLPLVLADAEPREPSERHDRARKVKPQLSEGELVKVAWARNQSEGEFIQGLLLEEGVPSMLRRSAGFDVPGIIPELRLCLFGALIIIFLVVEPEGLDRLWRNVRNWFRTWPFSY